MFRSSTTGLPFWLSLVLAITFVITGVIVSALLFLTVDAYLNQPLNAIADAAASVAGVELDPLPQQGEVTAPVIIGEATPTLIATTVQDEANERTNILIMGIDRRPGGAFVSRTDTMILASIDHETDSVYMLSVPRDFYAVIPGYGRDRINTAFVYGATGDNPEGGAMLAMQTIEYNIGVPVDHYVLIDFGAVIRGIDAIGGVDIYVPDAISDPTFPDMDYGFDPLYIPAGQQHFDGTTALKYARTRHQDNDYYRAQRQQQLIMAVRDRLLGLGITEMIRSAPTLYSQLRSGIKTDLSIEEIISLALAVSEINEDDIHRAVLDQEYLNPYRTETGASVLVPMNEKIAPLIQSFFYD